jgi:hypothetical protein
MENRLKDKKSKLLIALGTILLLVFYGKNLPGIRMVWQLMDEYGYLANAAYLSNTDWLFVGNQYYGYGYSLWLIPLFWVCKTGTQLIRGAVLFNTLCVLGIFWIQIFLMTRIFPKWNRYLVIVCSFVLCLYPYLVATDMAVVCECLLTLMVWICGTLLYQALHTGKWYYYLLLVICAGYTFFIHTRAIVFVAVLCMAVAVVMIRDRAGVKNAAAFFLPLAAVLVVGYLLKNEIIDAVYRNVLAVGEAASTTVTVTNTISLGYLWNLAVSMVTHVPTYVYSFLCKNFYLFAATAGMFHIGCAAIIQSAWQEWRAKKHLSDANRVMLMFAIAAILTVLAVSVTCPGNYEKPAYFFYGRYYEFVILPTVFAGINYCMEKKLSGKGIAALVGTLAVSAGVTLWIAGQTSDDPLGYDTFRMACFSWATSFQTDCFHVILICAGVAAVGIFVMLLLNRSRRMSVWIPLVLLVLFGMNDKIVVDGTKAYSWDNPNYLDAAYFIHQNYDVDEVYFLNGDDIYYGTYAGIQCMLAKEKLNVIQAEDLGQVQEGDVVITFVTNPYSEDWNVPMTKVFTAGAYDIYEVGSITPD